MRAVGSSPAEELQVYKKLTETQEAFRGAEIKISDQAKSIQQLTTQIDEMTQNLSQKDDILSSHLTRMGILQTQNQEMHTQLIAKEEECKESLREKNSLVAEISKKSQTNSELANQVLELETLVKALQTQIAAGGGNMQPVSKPTPSSSNTHDIGCPLPVRAKKVIKDLGELTCVSYNTTGAVLAASGVEKVIRLYDTATFSLRASLQGATQTVMVTGFSSDDAYVFGSSNDNATRIWQQSTQRLRLSLNGHTSKVFSGCFSMDATKAVTGSHDRTLKIWDIVRGYVLRTIPCTSACNAVCLNSDGTMAFSGHYDCNLRIWELRNGTLIAELSGIHHDQITSVVMHPDGTRVLTSSRDNTLKLIDINSHEVVQTYKHDEYRNGANWAKACISPDGSYIAAGSADGPIFVWKTETGKHQSTLKGHKDIVTCVSWNPNNNGTIASCDKSGSIFFWE